MSFTSTSATGSTAKLCHHQLSHERAHCFLFKSNDRFPECVSLCLKIYFSERIEVFTLKQCARLCLARSASVAALPLQNLRSSSSLSLLCKRRGAALRANNSRGRPQARNSSFISRSGSRLTSSIVRWRRSTFGGAHLARSAARRSLAEKQGSTPTRRVVGHNFVDGRIIFPLSVEQLGLIQTV